MCNLKSYILASYPLLWVKTYEEIRVRNEYASQLLSIRIENETNSKVETYEVWTWDIADGIRQLKLNAHGSIVATESRVKDTEADPLIPILWLERAPENTVLILKDYHNYLSKDAKDHDVCTRKIRNLLEVFKARNQALIIISPILELPVELNKEVTVLDYRLPGREELRQVMKAVHSASINGNKSFTYPKIDDDIIDACRGMTSSEAENALCRSVVDHKCFDAKLIQSEKANIVKKSGRLEIVDTVLGIADIGGLENLKAWLMARRECFSESARQFGITPPKGMLLVGVPGCGKSLTAKATASILGRPLLRLDMGNVFGSYVGESENNMRAVLEMCESIAPIVLWIR